jgi:excinuclease ABC subunit A
MIHPLQPRRPVTPARAGKPADPPQWLTVHGANLHNLRDVTARIPLARLVTITGVSGSGKSTLARDVLMTNLLDAVGRSVMSSPATRRARAVAEKAGKPTATKSLSVEHAWHGCDSISGWESIDRVLEVDQTPIGKTPRSCPATYIGVWDAIRKLFAETLEAKARGYSASRFSFNTGEAAARRARARACARSA